MLDMRRRSSNASYRACCNAGMSLDDFGQDDVEHCHAKRLCLFGQFWVCVRHAAFAFHPWPLLQPLHVGRPEARTSMVCVSVCSRESISRDWPGRWCLVGRCWSRRQGESVAIHIRHRTAFQCAGPRESRRTRRRLATSHTATPMGRVVWAGMSRSPCRTDTNSRPSYGPRS